MQIILNYVTDLHNDFKKCVVVSVVLHVSIILFLTVKFFIFPSDPIIIQNSIRVDVVDLPDKVKNMPVKETQSEPAQAKPETEKPKEKPLEKPKEAPKTVDLKKDKTKQLDAINKLKQMSALDKLKETKAEPTPQPAQQFRGNIINAGDSLTGIEKIQFDDYFSKLKSHVSEHWDLPQWLSNANLSAQAGVQIDERGFVIKKQLIKGSGNEIFDEKVLSTLEKSSPFPAPPNRLRDVVRARGIVFNFP